MLVTTRDQNLDENLIKHILKDVDIDGDGEITFEEFKEVAFLEILPPASDASDSEPDYSLEFRTKKEVMERRAKKKSPRKSPLSSVKSVQRFQSPKPQTPK